MPDFYIAFNGLKHQHSKNPEFELKIVKFIWKIESLRLFKFKFKSVILSKRSLAENLRKKEFLIKFPKFLELYSF